MLEKLEIDTLELVNRLVDQGIDQKTAQAIVGEIFSTKIYNISTEKEVTLMVAEAIQNVLDRSDARFEKNEARFEKSRSESDARFEKSRSESDARFEKSRSESDARFEKIRQDMRQDMKQDRKWIIGTIITVSLALASLTLALHHL